MRSPLSSTDPSGSQERPADLAREILEGGSYQTELPLGSLEPNWPDIPVELVELVFWVAVIGFGVFLLVWLIRLLTSKRAVGRELELAPSVAQGERVRRPRLEVAEEHAKQGRFGEATHELLLLTIAHLGRDLEQPPQPSDTSREILRALPLRGSARDDLRALVGRVEVFLFGGRALAESEYIDSLRRTRSLISEGAA